jgi:hypothetical protein
MKNHDDSELWLRRGEVRRGRGRGSVKRETKAISWCTELTRSSPWLRRWQRPGGDGGTTEQRRWRCCELGECEGREGVNEGQGRAEGV